MFIYGVLLRRLLVDETGTAELGHELAAKDLGETALVMIVAVGGRVVDTTDINDNVAGRQLGRVTGANEF